MSIYGFVSKDQKYLAVREFDHILYYRSTMCNLKDDNARAIPSVQRFTNKSNGVNKRINLNGSKDYFKSILSTRLAKVNEAIKAMNEEGNRIKEQPVETREIGVQAEPASLSDPIELTESYNGNCIMSVQRMEDFIKASNEHTQQCGLSPVLVERCTRMGAAIKWTYRCPVCAGDIILHNCDKVRTKVVAQTASRSRLQPAINLQIVQGMTLAGVNTTKAQEFLSEGLGIKIAKDTNLRDQQTKVRSAIGNTFEQRKYENRKKAVAARRAMANAEQLNWTEGGIGHLTSCGDICIDGAGATRSYGKGYKGSCAAANAIDRVTGLPLDVMTSQVRVDLLSISFVSNFLDKMHQVHTCF